MALLCVGAMISVLVLRGYAADAPRTLTAADTPRTLTVMTRNIYLGGNINRPIRAALSRTGRDGVLALGHATTSCGRPSIIPTSRRAASCSPRRSPSRAPT